MEKIIELIKTGDASIIDVRTPEEFMGGNVTGSVNIPLHEVPQRIGEFKSMKNIVLCCASGNRSGQATAFLKQSGINCVNGGSWMDVNYATSTL
jgi:rhodanese-related sulfurtransferase